MLEVEPKNWYREQYLVSTDPKLIQIDEINAALNSDMIWWANGLPRAEMERSLHNSLCVSLYALPFSTSETDGSVDSSPHPQTAELPNSNAPGEKRPRQVGLARIITDDVTFAYLTDVYILPEYQGKGLGKWLLECVDEIIKSWPHLRRFMFLTSDTMDFYRRTLGAKEWSELNMQSVKIGIVEGPGALKH